MHNHASLLNTTEPQRIYEHDGLCFKNVAKSTFPRSPTMFYSRIRVGKFVSVLNGNRRSYAYSDAIVTGCDPRKMLINVAKT